MWSKCSRGVEARGFSHLSSCCWVAPLLLRAPEHLGDFGVRVGGVQLAQSNVERGVVRQLRQDGGLGVVRERRGEGAVVVEEGEPLSAAAAASAASRGVRALARPKGLPCPPSRSGRAPRPAAPRRARSAAAAGPRHDGGRIVPCALAAFRGGVTAPRAAAGQGRRRPRSSADAGARAAIADGEGQRWRRAAACRRALRDDCARRARSRSARLSPSRWRGGSASARARWAAAGLSGDQVASHRPGVAVRSCCSVPAVALEQLLFRSDLCLSLVCLVGPSSSSMGAMGLEDMSLPCASDEPRRLPRTRTFSTASYGGRTMRLNAPRATDAAAWQCVRRYETAI